MWVGPSSPPSACVHDVRARPQDMSSLMHTIYEVVDASVNHSSGRSKTLRVKLTVSPEPSSKRKEGPPASQGEGLGSCSSSLLRCPEDPAYTSAHPSSQAGFLHPCPHTASPQGSHSPCWGVLTVSTVQCPHHRKNLYGLLSMESGAWHLARARSRLFSERMSAWVPE